jgi:hypothetical protein
MTSSDRYRDGDDDLPVLTHVLRTGDGRMPRSLMVPPDDDSYVDEFGIHHFEEAPVTRQIVIGHDPQQPTDDLDAATVSGEFVTAKSGRVADPRPIPRDPFRLSQDIDVASHGLVTEPIDEPPLLSTLPAAKPGPVTRDLPIEFSKAVDNATRAARLGDAIVTDLGSRIDMELDARIAQVLQAEIESALAQLQNNLRAHLTQALRDVVERAVGNEIARIERTKSDQKPH